MVQGTHYETNWQYKEYKFVTSENLQSMSSCLLARMEFEVATQLANIEN